MNLANKVAVVTGAGSGIGRELALELIRRQARVAAVDINEATLRETAELAAAPAAIATFVVNIADRPAVEALAPAVVRRFDAVDGVINCAGIIQPFVRLTELDYPAIERVFDVNWRGTLYMTKTFLPLLLRRPAAHLVNVSSMGGFLPVPGQTVYGASKAAVKLFTEGLHSELAGTPVRVTVVFPGAVATNIAANSGVAIPAMAGSDARRRSVYAADRAARDILDGMVRNRYRVLVGRDAKLMDAIYRLHPQRARRLHRQPDEGPAVAVTTRARLTPQAPVASVAASSRPHCRARSSSPSRSGPYLSVTTNFWAFAIGR